MDDGLLISLAVTCDQQHGTSLDLIYTLLSSHFMDCRIKCWHWPRLSVRPTQQLEIPADPKYFLLLSLCCFPL